MLQNRRIPVVLISLNHAHLRSGSNNYCNKYHQNEISKYWVYKMAANDPIGSSVLKCKQTLDST